MARITITFPVAGLSVAISVRERLTGSLDFSGTMTNTPSTTSYTFDFTEVANKDYIYVASATGGYVVEDTIYRDTASGGGGGGGASVSDIWTAPITSYSSVVGSFAEKFSQYGGVSHVIDRSSLDDASKKELKGFKEKMDEFNKTLKEFKGNSGELDKILEAVKAQASPITNIITADNKYEETLVELVPQLMDKLDEASQLIPIYEELITYMEQREADWEALVEDLINN